MELNVEVHEMQQLNIATDAAQKVDGKNEGYWPIHRFYSQSFMVIKISKMALFFSFFFFFYLKDLI